MAELALTREHTGGQFHVRPGDTVIIRLPENPTTGYRWAADPVEGAGIALADSTFDQAGSGIGAAGTRTVTYRAIQAGTAWVRLKQWREWEGEGSVIEHFEVMIAVQS